MEVACKIIRLRQENTSFPGLNTENVQGERITYGDLQAIVAKAKNVIDTMEEEWRMNNNSVILVDQLYLLRHYLEQLRRYYEGNI